MGKCAKRGWAWPRHSSHPNVRPTEVQRVNPAYRAQAGPIVVTVCMPTPGCPATCVRSAISYLLILDRAFSGNNISTAETPLSDGFMR